jgi:hypothetical protein
MKHPILALIAALCTTAAAHAAEPVRAWQGSRVVVKDHHLIPVLHEGEGYGEKYTFKGEFGDRGSFYFSLTISNLGLGDHKMESKGRLTIDGKKFAWKKELDEDEWSFDKKSFNIKAGPATISGTPERIVITAAKGSDATEMVFTPIARAWRPRNGQVTWGKEHKTSDFTVFPLMEVKGKYKLGGGDWQTIEGTGFGSRTWSDLAPYEQARWTMEFRAIVGDATVYFREIGATDEYGNQRIPYLLVTKGKRILIESFDYTLTPTDLYVDTAHENRYKVPQSFTVLGKDAEEPDKRQFRGKFEKKKLVKRKDMLESMSGALALVAKQYSKPVSYDYDQTFLIEVKVGDQVERVQGVGRLEVYHWNK